MYTHNQQLDIQVKTLRRDLDKFKDAAKYVKVTIYEFYIEIVFLKMIIEKWSKRQVFNPLFSEPSPFLQLITEFTVDFP